MFAHYRYRPDLLDALFGAIADAGTRQVYVEHLNTSPYILQRIAPVVAQQDAQTRAVYAGAGTQDHRTALTDMVLELVAKYDMTLRTGRVIDHNKKMVGK